jgi:hypothetical protein
MYEVVTTLLDTEQDNRDSPSYNWCQETLLFSTQQLKREFMCQVNYIAHTSALLDFDIDDACCRLNFHCFDQKYEHCSKYVYYLIERHSRYDEHQYSGAGGTLVMEDRRITV